MAKLQVSEGQAPKVEEITKTPKMKKVKKERKNTPKKQEDKVAVEESKVESCIKQQSKEKKSQEEMETAPTSVKRKREDEDQDAGPEAKKSKMEYYVVVYGLQQSDTLRATLTERFGHYGKVTKVSLHWNKSKTSLRAQIFLEDKAQAKKAVISAYKQNGEKLKMVFNQREAKPADNTKKNKTKRGMGKKNRAAKKAAAKLNEASKKPKKKKSKQVIESKSEEAAEEKKVKKSKKAAASPVKTLEQEEQMSNAKKEKKKAKKAKAELK